MDKTIRENFQKQISMECAQRIAGGITFNGHRFQTDPQSVAAISLFAALPARSKVEWVDADNNLVEMTAPDFAAFANAVADHIAAHVMAARQIKDDKEITREFVKDSRWPPKT